MKNLPLSRKAGGERFAGFDVMAQSSHWDDATRDLVESRLDTVGPCRFFSLAEQATAGALFDQLLDQRGEPRVPVLEMVDARLTAEETDGWHYETMPKDGDAWRRSLAGLDSDAVERYGAAFGDVSWLHQAEILEAVHGLESESWHGMHATQLWSLWTRYACTAFYSHPLAWQEMGFAGPAYPRGYKNIGLDRREPFEVKDDRPEQDPVRDDTA